MMNKLDSPHAFLSNPQVIENYALLEDIGVFQYIDQLGKEIQAYKGLLSGAVDIFNRTSIGDIIDAAVWQISDHFMPSFIAFLWRPLQNKEDVTIKGYRNYKEVNLPIKINTITPFEEFFQQHPQPIAYKLFSEQLGNSCVSQALDEVQPELIAPIQGPSGLYGLILVGRKILTDNYTSDEQDFLQHLMSFVSNAIQNHLHYERSVRDFKTGLFNHGFFITRLNEEISRSKRINYTSSIIVIDVDKFKDFNDQYGHLAGDRVLENIALVIRQNVRAEDIPSRFGGEEFTILLPDADKNIAWRVAERLRTSVANIKVTWDPPLPPVTISTGIYVFNKDSNVSVEDIINRADEALYHSKGQGRNCTTLWRSGLLFKIEHGIKEAIPGAPPG
ncbi:sensor domain-containing diguanylate cyclase [Treponema sp. TIM-1]|uniref:sensor domain-containing diguanylate cyclase n=1 Tax=Treponema sp. TIM-1 TaxID=2898417 RepID=UPI0039809A32